MTEPTATDDFLLASIVSLLTPLVMTGSLTDAQATVRRMIAAYRPDGPDELITVAQIVGFALASLDNLRLSASDVALSIKLKLRANANALHRATQRSATALENQRHPRSSRTKHDRAPAPAQAAAEPFQTEPSQTGQASNPDSVPRPERSRDQIWASAMSALAAECSQDLDELPEAQRRTEMIRINALGDIARQLARGTAGRSGLLSGTALGALRSA